MATTKSLTGIRTSIKLDVGTTTASGNAKIVSQNLGSLNPSTFDVEKAGNIVTALIPAFRYSFVEAVVTETSEIVFE